MSNDDAVRRFYDEVWNRGDTAAVAELLHPDVTFRGSLGAERRGHAGFLDYVREVTSALGDYHCEIEELVAQVDVVVTRMMFSGVHRAPLLGVEATGRHVAWAGVAFFRFDGRVIRDLWVLGDLHGLLRQLTGVVG